MIHTQGFGEMWEYKGVSDGSYIAAHPHDSQISLSKYQSNIDVLENQSFKMSYDYGETWKHTVNFISANDVAFHHSNKDIIVLIGDKVVISKDCGYTWETTKNWGLKIRIYIF